MSVVPPRAETAAHQPPAAGPMPELGETLKVVNVGAQTLRFAWNSRQYVIPPGGADFMPFDAVKVYVGDPRATNNVRTSRDSLGIVSFLPDRATEVRRLRLLYAAPFGEYMRASDVGGIFVSAPVESAPDPGQVYAWDGVHVPQVEVYNIRGERIYTVLDDPEGSLTIPVAVTQSHVDRTDVLARLVEQQASIIDALSARLGIDPNGPALDNPPDLIDETPPEPDTDPAVVRDDTGAPKMVYDTRSDTVRPRRKTTAADPTTLADLPEDRI